MQMNLTTSMNDKYLWAFAVDKEPPAKRYVPSTKPKRNLHRYYITACSKQAKAFGVRIGMTYSEARALVPNMRVIVYNR
jgi:nucleotidyltransferase/DNA polymerase involved in DNA repair